MNRKVPLLVAAALMPGVLVLAQGAPAADSQPPALTAATELADSLAQRLSNELHMRTVVGEPMKVGSVTLIPIMMVDVGFGGGGMVPPDPAPTISQKPVAVDGFFMSGEARPLGFVAVSRKGTRFINVAKAPAK